MTEGPVRSTSSSGRALRSRRGRSQRGRRSHQGARLLQRGPELALDASGVLAQLSRRDRDDHEPGRDELGVPAHRRVEGPRSAWWANECSSIAMGTPSTRPSTQARNDPRRGGRRGSSEPRGPLDPGDELAQPGLGGGPDAVLELDDHRSHQGGTPAGARLDLGAEGRDGDHAPLDRLAEQGADLVDVREPARSVEHGAVQHGAADALQKADGRHPLGALDQQELSDRRRFGRSSRARGSTFRAKGPFAQDTRCSPPATA
ncbi:hypothetical protein ACQPX6_30325 [Actinomycetospora sp. CA-101289]|uniref:hypothetical protein n=1 Tax=Actinomycetospora sp. CA-101289 TaxID=3239893 RepID=UPI003D99504B